MDRVGRFRIERCLGHGGMGEVYLAEDERLGRKVALKTVPPWMAASRAYREALTSEARVAAGLSHRSIAQVHDLIADGDDLYLVMEFVDGQTLGDLLRDGTPFETGELLRISLDIAEGLAAAHDHGIIHRDLKAENVVIDGHGRAKILDFGLAAVSTELSEGSSAGTLKAMSPEQVERRALDHRSDLFAFGTLLYQMATGTHPFRGSVPVETMHRICQVDPPAVKGPLPPAISALIMQLLAKDPEQRPQKTSEVVAVLRQALRHHERTEASAPPANRGRRWAWLTALVVLATVATWLVLSTSQQQPILHVAIVSPDTAADSGLTLVEAGVRMAAVRALSGLDGVYPINPDEVEAIDGDIQAIAMAVAADELISATIAPTENGCRVELTRLSPDNLAIWMDHIELPLNDLRLIADAVAASVRSAYPERKFRGDFKITATPSDYKEYLRLLALVADPPDGVSWSQIIDELADIRASSPQLIDAYSLAISVARYQYEATRDPNFRQKAEGIVQDLVALAPDHPRTLLAASELAMGTGDLDAAKHYLDRMQEIDPNSQLAMAHRARLANLRGRPNIALDLMQSAVDRRPSWWYLLEQGRMERHLGKSVSARDHLERANRLAPDNLLIMQELARFHMYGNTARAEELYLALVARSPNPKNLTGLGTVQLLLGKYEAALVSFRRAMERGSRAPETWLNVADCYALLEREQEARQWYRDTVTAVDTGNPETAANLGIRAQALAHLGRFDEAAVAIDKALEQAPTNAQAAFDAALVAALRGDTASASEQAQRAIQLGMDPRWFALPWFEGVDLQGDQQPPSST